MAEHDVIIRGGTVIDGTGAPRRTADVAIRDGVITAVGAVDVAPVGQLSVEDHHCSGWHFKRNKIFCWIGQGSVIEFFEGGAVIVGSDSPEEFAQWSLVAARCGPEASVLECCIFNREPESCD